MGKIETLTQELKGRECRFIRIPSVIVTNEYELGDKGLMTYMYFATKKGIDDTLPLQLSSLITWCGFKPKRGVGATNEQFVSIVSELSNKGYVSYSEDLTKQKVIEIVTDYDLFSPSEDYTYIYLDEIEKIMSFECSNRRNSMTNSILMMVFVYLRYLINKNKGYNGYYKDIATALDISEKTATKAIETLKELGFIRYLTMKRDFVGDKWYTNNTIFVSAYCRKKDDGGKLIQIGGEGYYKNELLKKKQILDNLK